MKWSAVREETGDFSPSLESLAGLNDQGKTFKEIADIIEEHAAEIFTRSV